MTLRVTVRRSLQPECPSDLAQPASTRHEEARDPARLRLWARLVPKLLL